MKHPRWVAATLTVTAIVATCALSAAAPALASGSCGDSWTPDGHSGPWYVGSNQSLHGNTLHIGGANCNSGTAWNVTYEVVKTDGSGGTAFTPIMVVRSGNGPADFSVATSPIGCNQGWLYYTQVKNDFTGNYIRKPNSGTVIC